MRFDLEKAGTAQVARLFGSVTERSAEDLRALDEALTKKHVIFALGALTRFDAAGERLWATLLNALARRATYEFRDCPVAFVEAVNQKPDLIRGGKIASFHAPLKCPACQHAATVLMDSARINPNAGFGAPPCGKCGRAMEAEVAPSVYFGFLFGD